MWWMLQAVKVATDLSSLQQACDPPPHAGWGPLPVCGVDASSIPERVDSPTWGQHYCRLLLHSALYCEPAVSVPFGALHLAVTFFKPLTKRMYGVKLPLCCPSQTHKGILLQAVDLIVHSSVNRSWYYESSSEGDSPRCHEYWFFESLQHHSTQRQKFRRQILQRPCGSP